MGQYIKSDDDDYFNGAVVGDRGKVIWFTIWSGQITTCVDR